MQADKGQFDEVLRRLIQHPPQKTSDIHSKHPKKAQESESKDQKSKPQK